MKNSNNSSNSNNNNNDPLPETCDNHLLCFTRIIHKPAGPSTRKGIGLPGHMVTGQSINSMLILQALIFFFFFFSKEQLIFKLKHYS